MTKLLSDAKKYPLYHALIVLFLFVGIASIPIDKFFKGSSLDEKTVFYICESAKRFILFVVGIVLVNKYGFLEQFKGKSTLKNLIPVVLALLVVVNNLPIIGLINKNVRVNANTLNFILFLVYCLSIGCFEETIFRGIVFPLCLIKLEGKNKRTFFAILLSSVLFSLTHLLNLLSGASFFSTVMQIGYTFLVGGMFAIIIVKTENLFIAVFLHFVFDIGGLMLSNVGIGLGNQWDTATIIITAILGVIVFIYMLRVVLNVDENAVNRLYFKE